VLEFVDLMGVIEMNILKLKNVFRRRILFAILIGAMAASMLPFAIAPLPTHAFIDQEDRERLAIQPYPPPLGLSPLPAHVFIDLHIGPDGELVATHTDGIYRTVNDGESWQKSSDVGGGYFIDGQHHGLFVIGNAGIYRSTDKGLTWSRTGYAEKKGGPISLTMDAKGNFYRYFDHCGGDVETSHDLGKTWVPTKAQPSVYLQENSGCRIIASGDILYLVGQPHTVTFSTDQGRSWEVPDQSDKKFHDEESISLSGIFPDGKDGLYVNTLRGNFYGEMRLYRVTDRWKKWDEITLGIRPHKMTGVKMELFAVDGSTLYINCAGESISRGLCTSHDEGQSLAHAVNGYPSFDVHGNRFKPGPWGKLYRVVSPEEYGHWGIYGIHRAHLETRAVQMLGTKGIPDPWTGRVD